MARADGRGAKKILTMLTHPEIQQAKAVLREQVRAELKKMSPAERAAASIQACVRLEEQTIWRDAQSILFYAPLPEELDLWRLLLDANADGKAVLLPRFDPEQNQYVTCHIKDVERDLQPGPFGIREPLPTCTKNVLNQLDLILVPGLAFDLNGHRLGRGKGFYDRLLAMHHGPTCGVAFDQQIVSAVPVEPHDLRLNCILTPTRWQCDAGPRSVLK
jgi:5-formyltetrahydrofolate cyclo-ligase